MEKLGTVFMVFDYLWRLCPNRRPHREAVAGSRGGSTQTNPGELDPVVGPMAPPRRFCRVPHGTTCRCKGRFSTCSFCSLSAALIRALRLSGSGSRLDAAASSSNRALRTCPKFQAPTPPSPRLRSSGVSVVSASVIAPPPAQQVHRGVEPLQLRKIGGPRHRVHAHLDAELGPHRRQRLADLLVVDVAVVRAVEGDFEALRIAGFGQLPLATGKS